MKNKKLFELKESPELLLQELMDEYMGFVYSIVYKKLYMVATKEDIEETVSDAFVKLYKSLDYYDFEKSSIKTFIAVISKNTATDKFRQLTANNVVLLNVDDFPEIQDDEEDTSRYYIQKEEQEEIFKAVFNLKEPNRTIIFRRFYLNETVAEIANKMRISPNAVQKRLLRTLKKLKTVLGGYFDAK